MGIITPTNTPWPDPWGCGTNYVPMDNSWYQNFIVPAGGWEVGYRPDRLLLTVTTTAPTNVYILAVDTDGNIILGAGIPEVLINGTYTFDYTFDWTFGLDIANVLIYPSDYTTTTLDCVEFATIGAFWTSLNGEYEAACL